MKVTIKVERPLSVRTALRGAQPEEKFATEVLVVVHTSDVQEGLEKARALLATEHEWRAAREDAKKESSLERNANPFEDEDEEEV